MFFYNNKKIIYFILAVCVCTMLVRYMSNLSLLLNLLISIPGVLLAITFHEYAHAFAAYKLGDDTAKLQGRMTLNPLNHLDPIGIFMLLFLGFGWGKPVQIDSRNFNRNISIKKAEAIVALAGPVSNFILAIIFSIITALLVKFNVLMNVNYNTARIIIAILQSIILMNIGLGLFNLIPLPPLDGSKVLSGFLPYKADMWFKNNEQIFYIIFLVLWITGLAGTFISPAIIDVYNALIGLVGAIFKISM